MVTVSADLTVQMKKYIDSCVKQGLYKSRSEVIRNALREKIEKEKEELRLVAKGVAHDMKLIKSGKMKTVTLEELKKEYGIK